MLSKEMEDAGWRYETGYGQSGYKWERWSRTGTFRINLDEIARIHSTTAQSFDNHISYRVWRFPAGLPESYRAYQMDDDLD